MDNYSHISNYTETKLDGYSHRLTARDIQGKGRVFYSYSTPIAAICPRGARLICSFFSRTTSKHQRILRSLLPSNFVETQESPRSLLDWFNGCERSELPPPASEL